MTTHIPEDQDPFTESIHEGQEAFEIQRSLYGDLEKVYSDGEVHIYPSNGTIKKVTKLPHLYAEIEADERDFNIFNTQSYQTLDHQIIFFYESKDIYLEKKKDQLPQSPLSEVGDWFKRQGLEGIA